MFSIFTDSGKLYDETVVLLGVFVHHIYGIEFGIVDYSNGTELRVRVGEEEVFDVCKRYNLKLVNKTSYVLGAKND